MKIKVDTCKLKDMCKFMWKTNAIITLAYNLGSWIPKHVDLLTVKFNLLKGLLTRELWMKKIRNWQQDRNYYSSGILNQDTWGLIGSSGLNIRHIYLSLSQPFCTTCAHHTSIGKAVHTILPKSQGRSGAIKARWSQTWRSNNCWSVWINYFRAIMGISRKDKRQANA